MPRYYMHVHDGGQIIEDLEGLVFPNLELAITEAEAAGREMLAEKVRMGNMIDGQKIEIVAEDGEQVAIIRFRELLHLHTDVGE